MPCYETRPELYKEVVYLPIKPIDYQVMIPRTLEAAKVNNDEAQKNHLLHQQQAMTTQQKADDSLKQVYSRSQAEHARIMEKQRENRQNDKKRKKDGQNPEESEGSEKSKLNNDIRTSTIDIKI